MASQKWKVDGFKTSKETQGYKNDANNSIANYSNFVNQGIQTSPATNNFYNQLQKLQNSNKLSGTFNYDNQKGYNQALFNLANQKRFSYDLSKDTLYNQMKDQYQVMGQQAMADTIGQASAMTGGYGNSYATTAGSQAYQGYMQQLNNNIADLYNLALNTHSAETNRLQNVFNAYSTDRGTKSNEWQGNWNVYNNRFNNLANAYGDSRNYDLNSYNTQANAMGNVSNLKQDRADKSETMDYNLWDKANQNKLSLYGLRDAWEQNQAENAYKDKALKADIDYKNRALNEEITHNRNAEGLSMLSALPKSSGSSSSSSSSSSTKKTYLSKIISNASEMVKNKSYPQVAKYLKNLDTKYYEDIPDILNAVGLPKDFLDDFYNGKISVKQK
jgi:hypothetical protein|nr:MAG TPA: hypothetical protein [Caudoviricetes sp.]